MGILDKAKDLIGHAAERLKDPDKDLVEKTWPAGQPDDEHLPAQADGSEDDAEQEKAQPGPQPPHTEPVAGADPELDDSIQDQYEAGQNEDEAER